LANFRLFLKKFHITESENNKPVFLCQGLGADASGFEASGFLLYPLNSGGYETAEKKNPEYYLFTRLPIGSINNYYL
jgi:hypothetical protein